MKKLLERPFRKNLFYLSIISTIFLLGIVLGIMGEVSLQEFEGGREGTQPLSLFSFDEKANYNTTIKKSELYNNQLRNDLLNQGIMFIVGVKIEVELTLGNKTLQNLIGVLVLDFDSLDLTLDKDIYFLVSQSMNYSGSALLNANGFQSSHLVKTISSSALTPELRLLISPVTGGDTLLIDKSNFGKLILDLQTRYSYFNMVFGDKLVTTELISTVHGRRAWNHYKSNYVIGFGSIQIGIGQTTLDEKAENEGRLFLLLSSYKAIIGLIFITFAIGFSILSIFSLLNNLHPKLALLRRMGFSKLNIMAYYIAFALIGNLASSAISILTTGILLNYSAPIFLQKSTVLFLLRYFLHYVVIVWFFVYFLLQCLLLFNRMRKRGFEDGEMKDRHSAQDIFQRLTIILVLTQVVLIFTIVLIQQEMIGIVVIFVSSFFWIGIFLPILIEKVAERPIINWSLPRTNNLANLRIIRKIFNRQFLLTSRMLAGIVLLTLMLGAFTYSADQSYFSTEIYNRGGEITFTSENLNQTLVKNLEDRFENLNIAYFYRVYGLDLLKEYDIIQQYFEIIGVPEEKRTLQYLKSFSIIDEFEPSVFMEKINDSYMYVTSLASGEGISDGGKIWYYNGNLSYINVKLGGKINEFPKFGVQKSFLKTGKEQLTNVVFMSLSTLNFLVNRTGVLVTYHYLIRINMDKMSPVIEYLKQQGIKDLSAISTKSPAAYLLEEPGKIIILSILSILTYFILLNVIEFRRNMVRPLFLLYVTNRRSKTRNLIYRSFLKSTSMVILLGLLIVALILYFLLQQMFYGPIFVPLVNGVLSALGMLFFSLVILMAIQFITERKAIMMEKEFQELGVNATLVLEGN